MKKDSDSIIFPMNEEDASVIMRQILDNAVKFTPEGTSVKVFLMEDGKRVVFSVRDFGEGFSIEDPSCAAVSGSQAPDNPASLKDGGVGLFLVREVLEKYRGTMHADKVEPGTLILVELPKN